MIIRDARGVAVLHPGEVQQHFLHAADEALLTAAKILTELDPEVLDHVSRAMGHASKEHQQEQKAPSLWQRWKQVSSEDGRRGLSFMTLILSGLGRSLKC